MAKTKQRFIEDFKYDSMKDEFYYLRINQTLEFDEIERKWVIIKKEPQKVTLEEKGLTKEVHMKIVFVREGLNPNTLKGVYGFFTQQIEAKIPNLKEFKHLWLSVDSQKIWLHNHREGTTQECTFVGHDFEKNWISDLVERIGKVKRITKSEAITLLKEKDTYRTVFSEDSEGNLSLQSVYTVKI